MSRQLKNLLFSIAVLFAGLQYGCAALVIGAGAAGAGVYAYSNGKLTRTYETGYKETVRASVDTLESLKIPIKSKAADEWKTHILAERQDGSPVSIEVVPVSPNSTEVGIRTGKVGIVKKESSYEIHDFISKQLEKNTASASNTADSAAANALNAKLEALPPIANLETLPEPKPQWPKDLTIYFDENANMPSQKELTKLDRMLDNFEKSSDEKIFLNGYSDSSGSHEYNKMLSLSRAGVVQMYLIEKGIDPVRLKIMGHGATNFAAGNDTEAGRRLNRRVEIHFRQE